MSVMVYSRLGDLLRARKLTVRDLQEQIAARFGLLVEQRSLDRLVHADRVRRPDLEIAAAAAAVLDVGLNEIFAVEAMPATGEQSAIDTESVDNGDLSPAQGRRLEALFDLQDQRPLTADEQAELHALVVEYGHRVHERGLRDLARQRNLPLERVRTEVATDLHQALALWEEVQADPARLQALVDEARERQQARRFVGYATYRHTPG